MGKREDKERRDQKAKKKNSLSYIYIYMCLCPQYDVALIATDISKHDNLYMDVSCLVYMCFCAGACVCSEQDW